MQSHRKYPNGWCWVIASIALLSLVAYVLYTVYGNTGTRVDRRLVRIRALGAALKLYADSNGGLLPPSGTRTASGDARWVRCLKTWTLSARIEHLGSSANLWHLISGRDERSIDSTYLVSPALLGRRISHAEMDTPMVWERHADHNGKRYVCDAAVICVATDRDPSRTLGDPLCPEHCGHN